MGADPSSPTIAVELERVIALAVETWRARSSHAIASLPAYAGVRRALREVDGILRDVQVSVVDPTGQVYDEGMAVRVLDVEFPPGGCSGRRIVVETLAPVVLHEGTVVRQGEVVVSCECHRKEQEDSQRHV